MHRVLLEKARELQEFFIDTFVIEAIEAAISTGNEELLQITVNEFSNQRQMIEDAERV